MPTSHLKSTPLRIIGDAVLHKAGQCFPEQPTPEEHAELQRQNEIATALLIDSGGAGIAANQCAAIAKPYQLIIVGVYHQHPTHSPMVEKRYPGVDFPEALVMVNPKIVASSQETTAFYHACLSVPGKLRGELHTPREISLEYKNIQADGSLTVERATLREVHAVVLQHELNHILEGKTYFDCCVAALKREDRSLLLETLEAEVRKREVLGLVKTAEKQEFYRFIHIKPGAGMVLEPALLKKGLGELTMETLLGLKKQVA